MPVKTELTVEDVQNLSSIAQIKLAADETESLQKDLNNILVSVNEIAEYADADVVPTVRPHTQINNTRPDEARDVLSEEEALQNAPEAEEGMFKVASILGGEQ